MRALYHGVLHRALDRAVKWRLIVANPCAAVDAPRPNPPEMQTWSADQVRTFLAATADDEYAALWRLACPTGMRRGGLLALRWLDFDVTSGMVAVRRTVSRGADGIVFGEPKTKAGLRSIELDAATLDMLLRHRVRQAERRLALGSVWVATGLIFDRGNGDLLHPNVVSATFTRLTRRADLPRIRFHDLRHMAATLMLANGEHPKVVQERLGHADIGMTLNLYSNVVPGKQRAASDRLAALLG